MMKQSFIFLLMFVTNMASALEERLMVIIIPSYNNELWCERNITSIITQDYENFKVIFIDDCSRDRTFEIAKACVEKHNKSDKVKLIRNTTRVGAMANLYNAIHSCPDNAHIVTVDGDDWLAHNKVLQFLNAHYSNEDIWLTYGQYISYPQNGIGFNTPFPQEYVKHNLFRKRFGSHVLPMSHLRTFQAWLFKRIKLEDFLYKGSFLTMTWDKAMMAPMVEMAGERHKCFTHDVLYVYNEANPINDHKVDMELQHYLCDWILAKPPYTRLPDQCEQLCVPEVHAKQTTRLVLFARNVSHLASYLTKIKENINNLDAITVVCIQDPFDEQTLESLLNAFDNLEVINGQGALGQKVSNMLNNCKEDYILLAEDCLKIPTLDMHKATYDLAVTGAYTYMLGNPVDLPKHTHELQLFDSIKAWQIDYAPNDYATHYRAWFNLYRTAQLSKGLKNLSSSSLDELFVSANKRAGLSNKIILFRR